MISEVCALCYWRLKSRAEVYSLWLTPHPLVRRRAECWSCWIRDTVEPALPPENQPWNNEVSPWCRSFLASTATTPRRSLSAERCIDRLTDWLIDSNSTLLTAAASHEKHLTGETLTDFYFEMQCVCFIQKCPQSKSTVFISIFWRLKLHFFTL